MIQSYFAHKAVFRAKLKMTGFQILHRIYIWLVLRRVMNDLEREVKEPIRERRQVASQQNSQPR